MKDPLEQALAALTPDAAQLARSVRTRIASLPPSLRLSERLEARAGRTELVFTSAGLELARLALRPGAMPRLQCGDSPPDEITGLASAAAAAARVRALAEAHTAGLPQLDLFGR